MHTEFALVDGRWREQGWVEAFRLRLTGWLPSELAASGVDKGALKWSDTALTGKVELSGRGSELTDAHPASRSEENIQMIANVLCVHGFDDSWLEPSDPHSATFIDEIMKFDPAYMDSIFSELKNGYLPLA